MTAETAVEVKGVVNLNREKDVEKKTGKSGGLEYYSKCPICGKVFKDIPITGITYIAWIELFCPECKRRRWMCIDPLDIY